MVPSALVPPSHLSIFFHISEFEKKIYDQKKKFDDKKNVRCLLLNKKWKEEGVVRYEFLDSAPRL